MKNQKNTILIAAFVFTGLLSCNTEKAAEQTPVVENTVPARAENAIDVPPLSSIPESTPAVTATIPPPSSLNSAVPLTNVSSAPFASTSTPVANSSVPVNAPKAAKSTARLNPAHGQPGHDCAIPVGAPLKGNVAAAPAASPAKAIAKSIPLESPSLVTQAAAPAPITTNPNAKINPAHGQPGHDCAVAVGAPLPVK